MTLTATARTVSHSRNYHFCDYCRRPDPALIVYRSLADCCQHVATLQIGRSGWLNDSYDTRTTDKLYYHYLTLSGSTPTTERWDGRPPQALQTHRPPQALHPRNGDFVSRARSCTDQHSALVADQLWAIPETRRSRGPTPSRVQAS